MRHKKIKSLLGAYYDGELNERERIIIEKHLEECFECRSELNLLEKIEEIVIDKICEPEENYWTSFPERVKERISMRERGVLKKAKSSFLKNVFLRPVSMKLAGAIALITIIFILSIFYYENFKSPIGLSYPERKQVPSHFKEQSEKVKEDTYGEEAQPLTSPQKMDKKKEIAISAMDKKLSETKIEREQKEMLGVEKEEMAREEKRMAEEEIILEKKEEEKMQRVSAPKSLSEEIPEEEKMYQEGLKLQQEGKYEEALQSYQFILYNYPKGRRAPNAQFQINTLSYSKLKKVNEDYLREIINSWKKFIEKYPDSEFIPSAKRNLGEACYQLAFLTRNKEDIEEAIKVLEDLLKLSTDEKEKFERMVEELKKIE